MSNKNEKVDQEVEFQNANEYPQSDECHCEEECGCPQDTDSNLEEELMKWRDTAMRTAAEYDNYRKRVSKDKEDLLRYCNQRFLEELLPVIDNFEMGLQAASNDSSSMIYVGMEMVKKQLDDFLSSQGVTPVETETGHPFDHNLHEAMMREKSPEPEGTILRVIRKGYMIKDRLLRPANVVVSHQEEDTATNQQEA